MSFIQNKDFALEVSRGNIAGISAVNKYGRNNNLALSTPEDVWDGPSAIWVAPTTARIHDIVSTSASDDGAPPGVGARTIRVFGLTAWNLAEVSEDIVMNGVTNVPTVNSYVIIHRLQVLTKGATNVNVGTITATAQVDGTVTATISPSAGQTRMCIYGVPSIQSAFMTLFESSIGFGSPTANILCQLLVNPEPDVELINFVQKHRNSMIAVGSSEYTHPFNPYFSIPGPAIIKLQAISDAANGEINAGFDLYLVDN